MIKKGYLKTDKRTAKSILVNTEQEEQAIKMLNRDTERSIKAQERYNRRFVSFEDAYEDGHSYELADNTPTPEE